MSNALAIIGATGFIGRHLLAHAQGKNVETVGTSRKGGNGLIAFDLTSPVVSPIVEAGCRAAVIAGAVPGIDACEADPEGARRVNVDGTLETIRMLAQRGIRVAYLSSDYVFDGERGHYRETDPVAPHTEYGRQKAMVEAGVATMAPETLVVRLSKVYGLVPGDRTLITEMFQTLKMNGTVRAAVDQVFCPTWVGDVASSILGLLEKGASGLVHVCAPAISRYELAVGVAKRLGVSPDEVVKVILEQIPSLVRRPRNTSMICPRLESMAPVSFMSIEAAIDRLAGNASRATLR